MSDAVDAPEVWRRFAPDLSADRVIFSEVIPGGAHWSWRLSRGVALRLVALQAQANCSLVLYAAHDRLERYNMPDSLKAQHTAHYAGGHVLMSDMGRAMASITLDTVGWHDPLGGVLDSARMQAKYGEQRFAHARNGMHRSGKDGLLIEIGKHGLGARDLIPSVNLFSKVQVDELGRLHFVEGHCPVDACVELRMDMDVVVAISTAPHPLDPRRIWSPAQVGVVAWRMGAAAADDPCRLASPECARAHHNSDVLAKS